MKIGKIICCAAIGALALSAIPYQFKNDEETGAVEIRSLLWGWRRTPDGDGEGKDSITFAIPVSGLDYEDEDYEDEDESSVEVEMEVSAEA